MSKRKHRWMLYEGGWRVQCRDCGENGTMEDANSVLDEFYARDERRCETCRHLSWCDASEVGREIHRRGRDEFYCSEWEAKDE